MCRGVSFESDYESIIGLSDARSDWLRQASENLQKGSPTTAALKRGYYGNGVKRFTLWNEVFQLETQISKN